MSELELVILDSQFRKSVLYEGWSSLVWAERNTVAGEFEIKSYDIDKTMKYLPVGGVNSVDTCISLRDSTVPMVVEDHKIEVDAESNPYIITTGREFTSVIDRRVSVQSQSRETALPSWVVEADSPSDLVWYVLTQIITAGIGSSLDIIPQIVVTDSVTEVWPQGKQKYTIEPKDLLEWTEETLALGKHGFRAILPNWKNPGIINLDIYPGKDRSKEVVFDVALDEFYKAQYLISKRNYKNTMITQTANGVTTSDTGTQFSGLNRRVDFQDLSSEITLPAGSELTQLSKNRGIVALADRLPTALFSGSVSEALSDQFNKTYFLGDLVKLQGDFGLTQNVRVAEFIRTQDEGEISSYPTFEEVGT